MEEQNVSGPFLVDGQILKNRRGYFWQIQIILVAQRMETVFDSAAAGIYFPEEQAAIESVKDCCVALTENFQEFLDDVKPVFVPIIPVYNPTIH